MIGLHPGRIAGRRSVVIFGHLAGSCVSPNGSWCANRMAIEDLYLSTKKQAKSRKLTASDTKHLNVEMYEFMAL